MFAQFLAQSAHRLRAALLAACVVPVGSCAPDQESVIVLGMPILSAACGAASGGAEFLAGMRVDLSFDTGLLIPLEIYNQIEGRNAGTQNNGINPAEIMVDSVDVEISAPQAPELIEALEDAHPNHVKFNLPLPTDSLGALETKVVFIQVPEHTLKRIGEMMEVLGYGEGAELLINFEFRFFFRRSGTTRGQLGLIEARPFIVPVHTGVNNLRYCRPTVHTFARGDENVEIDLCTEDLCRNDRQAHYGARCGNAQQVPVAPVCCMGTANFIEAGRSPRECGFQ